MSNSVLHSFMFHHGPVCLEIWIKRNLTTTTFTLFVYHSGNTWECIKIPIFGHLNLKKKSCQMTHMRPRVINVCFFFFLLSVLSMAMCLFIYKCKPNCALMRATSLDALFYAETEEFQHFRFYLRVWGVWRLWRLRNLTFKTDLLLFFFFGNYT